MLGHRIGFIEISRASMYAFKTIKRNKMSNGDGEQIIKHEMESMDIYADRICQK